MFSTENFGYTSHRAERTHEYVDSFHLYEDVCEKFEEQYPERAHAVTILFGQDVQRIAHVRDEEKPENPIYNECLTELHDMNKISEESANKLEDMISRGKGADHGTFRQVHEDKIALRMRNVMIGHLLSKYRDALGELSPEWKKHQRVH